MDYIQTVDRWLKLQATIRHLVDEERVMREALFNGTFTDPKEGVNSYEMPDGRILKGTYKLNRRVDQEGVDQLPATIRKQAFKSKWELKLSDYRKLDKATQKKVDSVLTVTPGLPGLEIVEP